MKPIPTRPVWYLVGRTSEGDVKAIERYWTDEEAQAALVNKDENPDGLVFSAKESESIIPDRTLPNAGQIVRLGAFLQRAFVVLRYISYGRENFAAIERLTDILHNFPTEMFDPERWDWNAYIHALRKFQEEFPDIPTMNMAGMLEDIRDNNGQIVAPNHSSPPI